MGIIEKHQDIRPEVAYALAEVLDEKNGYSSEHSKIVSKQAALVAEKMELEGEKIDRIRTAAFVYSIGRLIIPEHVLNRAAELTKEEKRIIKKYFKISFKVCDKILKHVSGFENIVPIVRAAGERWDGKGYSNRLKGEEIPLEARIIAVVDAYQMMCSNQPYQKKLSQEEAIEELKKTGRFSI